MVTLRCETFLGATDFEFGWRLCTRCRPPFVLVTRRARRITQMILDLIQERGLEFDPPLDPEAQRLRHLGVLARMMRPWCQCVCDRYLNRIRFDHNSAAAVRQRLDEDNRAAADDVTLMLLSQEAGLSLWETPVWIPTGTIAEWKARQVALVHNFWNSVLDYLGEIQARGGFTSVD